MTEYHKQQAHMYRTLCKDFAEAVRNLLDASNGDMAFEALADAEAILDEFEELEKAKAKSS